MIDKDQAPAWQPKALTDVKDAAVKEKFEAVPRIADWVPFNA